MQQPDRVTIPTCIGCGGMRVYETCETSCTERRLELVSAGDHELLTAVAAARRARIAALLAVVGELEGGGAPPGEWGAAYQALRASARSALRAHAAAARAAADDLPAGAQTVVVWRCPACGGLDAPHECIGVCIWRPAEWVNVTVYEAERSRAESDRGLERSLLGVVGRIAYSTPRDGEWERNWLALRSQARQVRETAE